MSWYTRWGKRCFDWLSALMISGAAVPVMAIAAWLIKGTSAGSVFFCQVRMGKGGRNFRLVKFRTMVSSPRCCGFTPGETKRVTSVGRWLRAWKIDELPQLFNVLRGDMSMVGPRPEVPHYRIIFEQGFSEVWGVRPGITDEASIKYRNEEAMLRNSPDPKYLYEKVILPDKLRLACEYVQRGMSFGNDIRLLLKTIFAVFGVEREKMLTTEEDVF